MYCSAGRRHQLRSGREGYRCRKTDTISAAQRES
jgi:hypothetical protein